MLTLPSGIKKYQATDNATVANFNVNADLLDAKITGLDSHTADTVKHITAAERTAWNAKETPAGAQAKADAVQTNLTTHTAATTGVHGATSAATASTLMIRDAAGRAKVAAPSASDDVARKDTVDNAVANVAKTNVANTFTGAQTFQVTRIARPVADAALVFGDQIQNAAGTTLFTAGVVTSSGTYTVYDHTGARSALTIAAGSADNGFKYKTGQVWHDGNSTSSQSLNGYQKLASGVIIQWGTALSVPTGVATTVTFPIAYPNLHRSTTGNVESNNPASVSIFNGNTVNFQVVHNEPSAKNVRWISIGY